MIKNGRLINPEVRIENTNDCNARCTICPREKMTRPVATMCWGHFCCLVDQAKKLGATDVSIFGYGEPLLDGHLESKIEYASSQGMVTHITTNGSLLNDERSYDLVDAGLKNLRISFHSTVPAKYGTIHKGLDWFSTLSGIYSFLKVNKLRGNPCKVHVTVIPTFGERLDQIRDMWLDSVDYLEVWRPHNWAYGRKYRQITATRKKTCGRPFGGPIQINADGKMMVCCFDFDARMTIGDTHKREIAEILRGLKLSQIQIAHRSGNHGALPCRDCDQLNDPPDEALIYSNRDPERKLGLTSTCKRAMSF